LELVEKTEQEITELNERVPEQVLNVGASPSIIRLAASHLLATARTLMPRVRLNLIEETSLILLDALRRQELDVLLAHDVPEGPGYVTTPMLREQLLFVTPRDVSHAIHAPSDITEVISLRKVLERELILPLRQDGIRLLIEQSARPLKLKPRIALQVQSPQALKILIVSQSMAGVLPYGLAAAELQTGNLSARKIVDPELCRTMCIVRGAKRLSEDEEAKLATLIESVTAFLRARLGPLSRPL
jgi:LysR family nitrogen assimilation transcriptional regulator